MSEKTLVVCGCSWSSQDPEFPNDNFGSYLSEKLGYNYINLAKPGCSNFGIRLQIDYAVENYSPSLLVISATSPCRTELKIKNSPEYDPLKLWENVDYEIDKHTNDVHPAGPEVNPSLVIDSISSVFFDDISKDLNQVLSAYPRFRKVFDTETHNSFKRWYLHHYNEEVDWHKQFYVLQSGLLKLEKLGINYIFSPNTFNFFETRLNVKELDDFDKPREFTTPEFWGTEGKYFLEEGISFELQEDIKNFGSWMDSPGPNYSHHLSPDAHKRYTEKLYEHIVKHQLNS